MAGILDGMVALVTGSGAGQGISGVAEVGPGIGSEIALRLAIQGARVAVNDVDADAAARCVEWIKGHGSDAVAVTGSVSDPEQSAEIVKRTTEHFGRLDILVNNAARGGKAIAVERMPLSEWQATVNLNLTGPFLMSKAVVPIMRGQKFGRIINISSIAGPRVSFSNGADYSATKAGLEGLTRHLSTEVGRHGITVNAISCGAILKSARIAKRSAAELAEGAARNPVMLVGEPVYIGWMAAWLASREAAFITGQAIAIDGGSSILPGYFNAYIAAAPKKDFG
ncbi:MAG: SDR family oxidoreductase [Betaproteobacteria bacterium]|nr:SDR family oxidoreductase [Betaproteobacteria bacterium]